MGRGLAKICAQKGANVIIVARNVDKLKAAIEYISVRLPGTAKANKLTIAKAAARDPKTQRFHYISADVTSPAENTRLLAEATAWNGGRIPDVVWANAGSARPTLLADTSVDDLRAQMDIDYWAAAYLARETIRAWVAEGKQTDDKKTETKKDELPRHLVITSSIIAFIGIAGYAPYAPAKTALRSLSDTLRSELQLYNGARKHATDPLRVPEMRNHVVFPGAILSPGFEVENSIKHPVTKLLEEDDTPQTEDEVAAASVAALEGGAYMVTTAFLGRLMRSSAMGGSARNGFGVMDTLIGMLGYIVWLFIGPDMERKVWKWGQKHGCE
jgi:3-dehydrosphinganine reductase